MPTVQELVDAAIATICSNTDSALAGASAALQTLMDQVALKQDKLPDPPGVNYYLRGDLTFATLNADAVPATTARLWMTQAERDLLTDLKNGKYVKNAGHVNSITGLGPTDIFPSVEAGATLTDDDWAFKEVTAS